MKKSITSFIQDESGATAIEYGLIAGLISIVIITGLTLVGDNLQIAFDTIGDELAAPAP